MFALCCVSYVVWRVVCVCVGGVRVGVCYGVCPSTTPNYILGKILEKGRPHCDTKPKTSPGKILEQKTASSSIVVPTPRNYAPGRSISLFKILKGKLPGSRIAEFLGFRRSTWPTNCRKWLRIAGNCLRIAIRIAELPSELPGKSGTENAIRSHAQPSITSCLV